MTRADIREQPIAWPSCTLGGWSAAWIAGHCSPDEVISALTSTAGTHVVDDHTGTLATGASGVLDLLAMLREVDALVVRLPDAGDPAGLPPDPATTAAFAAGEVLLVRDEATRSSAAGPLALIPSVTGARLSGPLHIDDAVCRWAIHRYERPLDLGALTSGGPSAGDLEHELRQAVRDATDLFSNLGGGARAERIGDLRAQLMALTARHHVPLPPYADARATRIVETAARVEAIVDLAVAQRVPSGDSAGHLDQVDSGLRRLLTLTRTARAAAVNATIAELMRPPR
uniref:serine/threonine protein kinase n=1 Tax=Gordonia sp. B7-2 TaxID=3420932 RepID=UPI003D8E317E